MKKLLESISSALLKKAAVNGGFYRKRSHDAKLEWCEEFLTDEYSDWIVEPYELMQWLDDNPPLAIQGKQKHAATSILAESDHAPRPLELPENKNGFVVVSAQNNTEVCPHWWSALTGYCKNYGYQLIVLPVYYNKNAFSAAVEDESEYFTGEVMPYLVTDDVSLFDGMAVLRPTAAINPTAKLPINKAVELNGGELSTVVATTKLQHRTLPTAPSTAIREAWATGTVTVKNYIRGGAGASAAKSHKFAAVVYELTPSGGLHSRNIEYKNGELIDFLKHDSSESVLTLGDLHSEMRHDPTWSQTLTLAESLQPNLIVVHDILHFSTKSHHNRNDGLHLYKTQNDLVKDDLRRVIDDLNTLAEIAPVYLVESNHNSALDNWLHDIGYNPKRDPRQAKIYYLLNWLVCDSIDNGEKKNALQIAFENLKQFGELPELSSNVVFGRMDRAYIVHGTDFSQHGHKGQNGSAGNTRLFAKWLQPMVTGHTHSPAIEGDVTTVGVTASTEQGYNRGGASSWRQSHAITHRNGATQLIHVWALSF